MVLCCLVGLLGTAPAVSAQEAFINQIGSGNVGANVDLSSDSLLATLQVGRDNTAVQLTGSANNTLATAQLGNYNTSAALVEGTRNTVATVQLGLGHTSLSTVRGTSNQLLAFQSGSANISDVGVVGDNATTTVMQNGLGLSTRLRVQDNYNGSAGQLAPLNVMVNQSANDPPVNASVRRSPEGSLIIKPGNATTVLRLPG
jgi:hypothetical protein